MEQTDRDVVIGVYKKIVTALKFWLVADAFMSIALFVFFWAFALIENADGPRWRQFVGCFLARYVVAAIFEIVTTIYKAGENMKSKRGIR